MNTLILAAALATSAGPFTTDRCTSGTCNTSVASVRDFRPVTNTVERVRDRVKVKGPIRRLLGLLLRNR